MKQFRIYLTLGITIVLMATAVSTFAGSPSNRQLVDDYFIYLPIINASPAAIGPGVCATAEETLLIELINEYRNENGLPDVPTAKTLTAVAQWHVLDLHENNPDSGADPNSGLPCNMHSWSNWKPDLWTAVCYTGDHAHAAGMWFKPREISGGIYTGYGFENAYGSSGQATATGALNGWKNSPGHNDVILEQGIWSGYDWPAMGVGIYEHHAVLWFGDVIDPQGNIGQCP